MDFERIPAPAEAGQPNSFVDGTWADNIVGKFLEKHPELTDQAKRAGVFKLRTMATEFRNCATCTGYGGCKNAMPGYFTRLEVAGMGPGNEQIIDKLSPCRKFNQQAKEH